MKKGIITIGLILNSLVQYAQTGDIVISSESGELINVSINGVKQNATPQANVIITGLKTPSTTVTVSFPNTSTASATATVNVTAAHELTYKMKKNNGQWQFILFDDLTMTTPGIGTAIPTPTPLPPAGGQIETTSTSVTQPNNTLASATVTPSCGAAMTAASFTAAKGTIASATSENSKLSAAKQMAQNNCLSPAQITDVMKVFASDASKLDFTKFAYTHTSDKTNYTNVLNGFSSESAKKELSTFIQLQKK